MTKRIPNIKFKTRLAGEWVTKSTDDFFKGKRVVVFSLPGAFTPTCSNEQLPNYERLYEEFKRQNIDDVYCISVNDSFVMNAWADELKITNVKMIPDGSGDFTRQMGMLVEKNDKGFGYRSWRYAMIVNDGNIEEMFEEPGRCDNKEEDPYGYSKPENIISFITKDHYK